MTRPVFDIRRAPSFLPDPPRRRASPLPLLWRRQIRRGLRAVVRTSVMAAAVASLWISRADFAAAPQPTVGVVQGASSSPSEEERKLEEQLQKLEEQIDTYDRHIQQAQQEKQSLQRDVSLLETKIKKLDLQMKATDLQVKRLTSRIRDIQSAIYESQLKIARQKEALANSLQAIFEADQVSLLEMMLADASIAEFFANVNAIYALQLRAQTELDQVYALKQILEEQETALSEAKEDQVALLLVQQSQKEEVDAAKRAKAQLLELTKGKESLYKELKSKAEKTAAEIRAQLFRLRGGGELSFGDAYAFAKTAGNRTGVRPALILAVLSQESALGRNVGQCRLADTSSGTTVGINTGRKFPTGMHPTRDLPLFLEITAELGLNPESMPVSCPILSDGAYGGAMGIAQFLPSTWMRYKQRIKQIVGHTPSPWDPGDAFMATALYLADAGATAQTFEAEREAAAKYYAGGRWRLFLRSYGDRVMSLAQNFQEEINVLERESR